MKRRTIEDLSVMIAGKAGDGVLFIGNVLARLLKRQGWEVGTSRDFPSNIRGEDTSYTVRATQGELYGRADSVDVLMAFNCESCRSHVSSVTKKGIILCDGGEGEKEDRPCSDRRTYHPFPLRRLARENFGKEIYKNMIVLGAMNYILDLDDSRLDQILDEMFRRRKGEEIVQRNIQAAALGHNKAKEIISEKERHPLKQIEDKGRIIIMGDEAVALGALAAGCRFFAAYPICPASEISQWLALYMPQFGGLVVQTEDELAALNMTVGASYAGARAMTATSGPGASLMMEAFSLSGITETPVVIAHVQRLGPATGVPTKTQQGDIIQWIFGSHGEFPRIVLSPGSVEECFEFTAKAFNLADKFQCPVIILTELEMGQNLWTTKKFDLGKIRIDRGKLLSQEDLFRLQDFKRYEITADGISPRSIPSQKNGIYLAESLEHDEKGLRSEDPSVRVKQMEKRMMKLNRSGKDLVPPRLWGEKNAEIGIITCGSTLGPALEARELLKEKGLKTKVLQLRTLWPFPAKDVEIFADGCKAVYVVENNFTGQLAALAKSQVKTCLLVKSILKYSTQGFTPGEIVKPILKALR